MKSSSFPPAWVYAYVLVAVAGCDGEGMAQVAARGGASSAASGAGAGPAQDAHARYASAGISCEQCHPCGASAEHTAAWMDERNAGFHARPANAGLAQCQGCHGADLQGGASANVSCAACHGAGWQTNCTMCHGGVDGTGPAPPRATWGNESDPVRTGAHTAHLKASHALAQPVACEACHVRPADALTPGHIDSPTATVTFSGLAAQSPGTPPSWTRETATCASTYCHGGGLLGGRDTSPVWTVADGSQRTCGSCHGAPPPNVFHARPDLDCSACHPAGDSALSASVTIATHLDGKLDFTVGCTSCHGDPLRDPAIAAAPPAGTHGETSSTALAVGAHLQHLLPGPFARAIPCEECHAVPTSPLHANGAVEVAFGPLARSGGANPTWARPSATCASTYCHGGTLAAGGDRTAPVWTQVDGTQAGCGSCHAVPPPPPHPALSTCETCHPGYTASSVDPATHIDGKVDVVLTCTSCHGDPARAATALNPNLPAAPPRGTHDETATTTRAVGAHLQHLGGGALTNGIACTECHALPSQGSPHPDGSVQLTWGPLARTGGAAPVWSSSANTCSATWCHGAKLSGGTRTAPVWTAVNGTQDACGTCHGRPPPSGRHGESDHRVSCGYCHGGVYTTTAADKVRHVDGKLQVDGPRIRSWDPLTRRCQPTCHSSETWDGH